jgi:hypothetical protein
VARLTEAETAAAVAELREIVGERTDLLDEVAGVLLGAHEGALDEAKARAAAQLCRPAVPPGWCRRKPDSTMDRRGTAPGGGPPQIVIHRAGRAQATSTVSKPQSLERYLYRRARGHVYAHLSLAAR